MSQNRNLIKVWRRGQQTFNIHKYEPLEKKEGTGNFRGNEDTCKVLICKYPRAGNHKTNIEIMKSEKRTGVARGLDPDWLKGEDGQKRKWRLSYYQARACR